MDTFLVNWSGQPIPPAEMMVMRRAAVEMRSIYAAKEIEFTHEICAGIVRFVGVGVFGAVGGMFFFGDFGSKNGQLNTVDFFIPRKALHSRGDDLIVCQSMRYDGARFVPRGYPDDIDASVARGAGKMKITVRQET